MTINLRLCYVVFAHCLGTLQFGYHLTELNAPEAFISCRLLKTIGDQDCIPMTVEDIGIITSIYSLGGLVAAYMSGHLAGKYGRKNIALLTCIPYILGPLLMGSAQSIGQLKIGRFLCGLGAGSSVVVVPLYLNEISPVHLRGRLGFTSQFAINIGILLAQVLGLVLSDYDHWRYILYFGAALGAINAVLLVATPESPKWLATSGRLRTGRRCLEDIRKTADVDHEFESYVKSHNSTEEETLLEITEYFETNDDDLDLASNAPVKNVSTWTFCTDPKFRQQLVAVCGVMAFQQICGVNSIVFYGVGVLADLLPNLAPTLNCIISVITCFVTIASASIVDKHGRKVLLLMSIACMAVTATSLGYSIEHSRSVLSAFSAAIFVVSFALGLGPVPFMIVPELVAQNTANAAQSVGSTINWLSQFLVGLLFPILQQSLGGQTYYLFALVGFTGVVFIWYCVPETKGKTTMIEVWG